MFFKLTKKLFHGKYQYKIVLICPGAGVFRNNDLDAILRDLEKISLRLNGKDEPLGYMRKYSIKTQEELDYAFQLHDLLTKLQDIDVRIESPWISIYTNSKKDVDSIAKLSTDNVKYISKPPEEGLGENTVILPKISFDYRVTMGKTTQEYDAFVQWAESNSKIKLTKSCKKDLLKPRTWGGKYFYVTGDNNLLLAKMHLGGSISKVERIIKA